MKAARCFLFALTAVFVLSGSGFSAETGYGVDEYLKAAKHDGGAAVVGVVEKVFPADKRFSMVDSKKFGCCDTPENCVTGSLPVEWNGSMPIPKSTVRVRGKVEDRKGKLIFVAESVKLMETVK